MRIAFFTVLFPENLKYLNQFLHSLVTDDGSKTNLIFCIDGITNFQIPSEFNQYFNCNVFYKSGNIARVREDAFAELLKFQYDAFVFIDSDDLVEPNRLQTDKMIFCYNEDVSIIVHDILKFMDTESPDWSKKGEWFSRFSEKQIVSKNDIIDYNFIGLGNISLRKKVLETKLTFNDIRPLDWFISFQWLANNHKTIFTSASKVGYRQHTNNLVGLREITEDRLINLIEARIEFFNSMALLDQKFSVKLEVEKNRYILIKSSSVNQKQAINKIRNNAKNFFWWEEPTIL